VHGGAPAVVDPVGEPDDVRAPERDPLSGGPVGPLLGSGGFASVWELEGGRVLKLAHASHDLARARLAREAEALGAIGAPAVPQLHGSGVLPDGRAWIVMDKVVGTTFTDLTIAGAMRAGEAVTIGLATLDALSRVHAAKFVHRDLKPDNLVRRPDGKVVILDLGLARKIPVDPDDPTRANVQVGSLEYIPPEQIVDSASVDERSDLYAFGCVLYELCAGRPPFVGDAAALERAHAALRPPRLGALATVPAVVESLCSDCLAKEPARRPASANAARVRLVTASDTPSGARMSHSMSMIREGKQPVVLLWAELPRVDRALIGMLGSRRLAVASQRGRRVLAGALGGEHADPANVAIATARDLAAQGARVALHLDSLRVGGATGAWTLHGEPIDKPETWLPPGAWTGVLLTRALASVIQAPTRPSDLGPEFRALAEEATSTELLGRDALLTDLAADAMAAMRGIPGSADRSATGTWRPAGPAFALLFGDAGVGKTAFASELARRLADLNVRVHLGTLPTPGTGRPGHAALEGLIGTPQGPVVRAVGDALRAAAREKATAVILDDLHLAEHDLLDALEYATLGGEPLPLWVLGIAGSRLDARRPQLGNRAERRRRDVLPPLEEDAAVALAATLLKPAEYPPLRALRRLVGIAHGNPLHLAMLAREIHQRGAVRERPGGGHFLDTSALDELQPAALGPWLAARELAPLSGELVALARLCAVLGGEVRRDELGAVVEAVERAGGATTTIDVDVGLRELVTHSILQTSEHGWMFAQSLVEEGTYATTNEDERATIHRAALEVWHARPLGEAGVAERVARHGEALGERRIAATAFAMLGTQAHGEHRELDADQLWAGAVRNLDHADVERGRAMVGRARARYRLQRVRDALADLDEASRIADSIDDARLKLDVELERAAALDWGDDYPGSAQAAAKSRTLQQQTPIADLAIEVELAEARSLFRDQQFEAAAPRLQRVRDAARGTDHYEAETIAGLLLILVLVDLGRYPEADEVFGEVVSMCEARDDKLHLGAAYANRSWLWSARGEIDRCAADLRRVIQLAREIGQASLERIATYNLGEAMLWQGSLDDALRLARRSASIQRSHGEGASHFDELLIARILAARADRIELGTVLDALETAPLSPTELATVRVLRCAATEAPMDAWGRALREGAEALTVEGRLELSHLALRCGRLPAELREELRVLKTTHPTWASLPDEF
jgi:tetratricopeptide (TPR) repeat protein